MNDLLPTVEYRCPGESYSISRAVHLARLGDYYSACRDCPQRHDTAGLSARQVRRLREVHARPQESPWFGDEGIRDALINDLRPRAARTIAIEFARRLTNANDARRPTMVFASDGRLSTAMVVAAVVEGLRWMGCETVDLGPATAPCMALAVEHLAADGGIYLGNPGGAAHTVGMKFWARGEPLSRGDFLDAIAAAVFRRIRRTERDEHDAEIDRPTRAFGPLRRMDAADNYLKNVRPAYHALRPLRCVIDCSCDPVFAYMADLTRNVACRMIPAEPGGDLGAQVVAGKAHFGIEFTDDGENARVYDDRGEAAAAERLVDLFVVSPSGGMESVEASHSPSRLKPVLRAPLTAAPPCDSRQETFRRMKSNQESLAADAAGRLWYAADHAPVADAVRTLTLLLVLLSRDDRALSALLDRLAGTQ